MSLNGGLLNERVTSERLAELGRIISDANRLEATALLAQALALVSFYSLFSGNLSFWTLVPEAFFVSLGLGALLLFGSKNPSVRQLNTSLTIVEAALAAAAVGLTVALFSSSDAVAFLFFLPGPVVLSVSLLIRRIVAHDVKLRVLRGAPVGSYGNLQGLVADLTPYGVEPSTRIRPRHVATWVLFFEGMTITSILRANAFSQ